MSQAKRGPKVERPYDPEVLLRETEDISQGSHIWPNAIWRRLDRLVECANEGGMEVTRSDMSAAAISSIEFDPESLVKMMLRYRTSTAADIGMMGDEQTRT